MSAIVYSVCIFTNPFHFLSRFLEDVLAQGFHCYNNIRAPVEYLNKNRKQSLNYSLKRCLKRMSKHLLRFQLNQKCHQGNNHVQSMKKSFPWYNGLKRIPLIQAQLNLIFNIEFLSYSNFISLLDILQIQRILFHLLISNNSYSCI